MEDDFWDELHAKALSSIQTSLANDVLREVEEKTTEPGIWMKLESIYMMKSLLNRLYWNNALYISY